MTITGAGFFSGATVSIGGTGATGVTVANSTSIGATTPVHTAGAVSVVVTNTDRQSGALANGYTYTSSLGLKVPPRRSKFGNRNCRTSCVIYTLSRRGRNEWVGSYKLHRRTDGCELRGTHQRDVQCQCPRNLQRHGEDHITHHRGTSSARFRANALVVALGHDDVGDCSSAWNTLLQAVGAAVSLARAVDLVVVPGLLWRRWQHRYGWSAVEPQRNPGRNLHFNRECDFGFYDGGNLAYVGGAIKRASTTSSDHLCQ